jgi:hypothetical protein
LTVTTETSIQRQVGQTLESVIFSDLQNEEICYADNYVSIALNRLHFRQSVCTYPVASMAVAMSPVWATAKRLTSGLKSLDYIVSTPFYRRF